MSGLEHLFGPRSIAIVGVSTDPTKVASIIFRTLKANSLKGTLKADVYAVNPRYRSVGEDDCYPDLRSLPSAPELLVVAIPVTSTLDLIKEAAAVGVKAIVIISGGFAEAGRRSLEEEIAALAARNGIRILGPNTIGLLDMCSGLNTLFLPETKKLPSGQEVVSLLPPLKGGVVIISQSGHLGEIVGEELRANRVGVRALVGVGNQLDISIEDVISFFADDPQTKVIAVYMEGLKDGRRFLEMTSKAARKKPVVVFKMGKTEAGAKAALTHTASMVGDYQTYKAALKQAGALEAESLESLVDCCIAFSLAPEAAGRRVLIVTNAGGTGAIAADESERLGLAVAPLSRSTLRDLKTRFKDASFMKIVTLNNPLDLTATATTSEFMEVSQMLVNSADYDMMVIFPTHQPPTIDYSIVERTVRVAKSTRKPVVVCTMGTSELANMLHGEFLGSGVPSFRSPERAVRALAALAEYHDLRHRIERRASPSTTDKVAGLGGRPGLLLEPDAGRLLSAYGIQVANSAIVQSEKEVLGLKDGPSFPVACKLLSKGLIHKTEKGGVILSVEDKGQLGLAFRTLKKVARSSGLTFDGVLVQQMVTGGVELILGGILDKTFGPTVMFGVGGVYTEVFKDYAMAVAPVSKDEALRMISGLKMSPLLSGYRGGTRLDLEVLAETVSRFSRIQAENPSVQELEINPLIATEGGVFAVDARIVLR